MGTKYFSGNRMGFRCSAARFAKYQEQFVQLFDESNHRSRGDNGRYQTAVVFDKEDMEFDDVNVWNKNDFSDEYSARAIVSYTDDESCGLEQGDDPSGIGLYAWKEWVVRAWTESPEEDVVWLIQDGEVTWDSSESQDEDEDEEADYAVG